jgi:hypothetical protein
VSLPGGPAGGADDGGSIMKRRFGGRRTGAAIVLALAVVSQLLLGIAHGPAAAAGEGFLETFDGSPAAPTTWRPKGWLNSNVSSVADPYQMLSFPAGHGTDCGAPPASHALSGPPMDGLFLCKDHVMTAGKESQRLSIVPPVATDVRGAGATVAWDASTLGSSERDWQEIWLVPVEDDFQITGDFERQPQRGVKIVSHLPSSADCSGCGWFGVTVVRDGREVWQAPCCGDLFTARSPVSASRRDRFEFRVSQKHVSFTAPAYGMKWADADVPAGLIDWGESVIYLSHAAYSPSKGGECLEGDTDCGHNTWHWDNLSIQPGRRFDAIDPDRRLADRGAPELAFDRPAPAGAILRFWSPLGWNSLDWSLDGGASWQRATPYRPDGAGEHAQSFKLPVPAGTQRVRFRNAGGDFKVIDARLVAFGAEAPAPVATAPATATATEVLPTATRMATAVPATATPVSTAVPPTATAAVATATPTTAPPPASPTRTAVPPTATRAAPTRVPATPTVAPTATGRPCRIGGIVRGHEWCRR